MDFSVAIKLEKDRLKENQAIEAKGAGYSMQIIKKESSLQDYFRNAGQANFELAQYYEALQHFNLALKEEQSGVNLLNRSLCYIKLGNHEEAKVDL